jgi:hypothetical protein
MQLAGKRALVTGASHGIGKAIALAFAREGADVALTFRGREEGARDTERQIVALGRRVSVRHAEVTDLDDCPRVVEDALRDLGGLDVLVNNAGGGRRDRLLDLSLDDWRYTLDLCVTAPFLLRMMPFFSGFEQHSSSKVIDDAVAIVAAVREAVGPHVDLDRSRPTRYWRGDPRTSVVQLSVPACAHRRQLSSRRLGRALAVLRAISASLPTVNDGSTRLARLGQFLPQRGDLSIGQAVTQQVGAGATPALVEVVQGLLHAMGRRVPEVCVLVPQPSLVRHPGPPFGQELVAQA